MQIVTSDKTNQYRLNELYNNVFSIDEHMIKIRNFRLAGRPMFKAVENCLLDTLEKERCRSQMEIDKIWEEIEVLQDALDEERAKQSSDSGESGECLPPF